MVSPRRSPPHRRRRQQQQQPAPNPSPPPAARHDNNEEGGTLLFLTNLLVGAFLSWGLLSASRYFDQGFAGHQPKPPGGGQPSDKGKGPHHPAVLDPLGGTYYRDQDERKAAAARFLLDRWAAHDGGGQRQLQRPGAAGYLGEGKGVGLYQPQQSRGAAAAAAAPSSLQLRSGQLIQDRYVLDHFIQDLGALHAYLEMDGWMDWVGLGCVCQQPRAPHHASNH